MIILLKINIIVEIIHKWKYEHKLTFVGFEPESFCTRVLKWRKN